MEYSNSRLQKQQEIKLPMGPEFIPNLKTMKEACGLITGYRKGAQAEQNHRSQAHTEKSELEVRTQPAAVWAALHHALVTFPTHLERAWPGSLYSWHRVGPKPTCWANCLLPRAGHSITHHHRRKPRKNTLVFGSSYPLGYEFSAGAFRACVWSTSVSLPLSPEHKQVFNKCLMDEWICELIKKQPGITSLVACELKKYDW